MAFAKRSLTLVASAAILSVGMAAEAQESAGQHEFIQACASCHGADGRGDGPLAGHLAMELPDLTTITARNDGEFPMLDVIMTIDGRAARATHGFPMPVWGDRFETEAGMTFGPYGGELVVRGRILALAEYLHSIQD
ncbi:c-type cytochrome [Rhodobacterales bacterium HKCCE2091]|nr:c-type cytochrome [Rhodobacterales bacterium HKCCE2091]